MAGNIIPAIATTNAITAGIVVMRAFNVLQEEYDKCQSVYVRLRLNPRNQIFVPDRSKFEFTIECLANRGSLVFLLLRTALMQPNPKCIVCSAKPEVLIKIDTKRVTVKQFRDDVLIKALNMVEPEVYDGKGAILISSDEDETECNNDKLLSDMQIVDGCILKVDDFFQNYELSVVILHKDVDREGNLFDIIADPDTLKADSASNEKEAPSTSDSAGGASEAKKRRLQAEDDDDDDLCLIEDDDDDGGDLDRPSTSTNASGNGALPKVQSSSAEVSSSIEVDDDVCITLDDDDDSNDQAKPNTSNVTPKKRRVEIDNGEPSSKRSKTVDVDDEILLLDDD